jgi:16S rRNA processing protein RimM
LKSSSKSTGTDAYIRVGRVTGAHGIRGGLKIHLYSDSVDLFHEGEPLRLSMPDGSIRSLTIAWATPHGHGLRMGLDGVNDRNSAEDLVGASLYYEKARLPELEDDTYYWFDLVGLAVIDTTGRHVGRLDSIIPTAANDVYVVHGEENGAPTETLIPAIGDVVQSVDLEQKTMIVEMPRGL